MTQTTTRAAVLSVMGAARPYADSRPLSIETLTLDAPGPGEVRVAIRAAGLCHSDLSVINGDRPRPMPMALGHEATGIVEQTGDGLRDFAVGDRVRILTGGGVTRVGKRLGQARTQAEANAGTAAFELPSYTTAKLMAYWRLSPTLNLSLDVDNVFDKVHYTSSYSRVWVAPGAARTVTLGLQAKF